MYHQCMSRVLVQHLIAMERTCRPGRRWRGRRKLQAMQRMQWCGLGLTMVASLACLDGVSPTLIPHTFLALASSRFRLLHVQREQCEAFQWLPGLVGYAQWSLALEGVSRSP